ncbi:MAG: hypothetical protein ACLRSW_08655 [Christensenellaceae bacterium]
MDYNERCLIQSQYGLSFPLEGILYSQVKKQQVQLEKGQVKAVLAIRCSSPTTSRKSFPSS